MMSSDGYISLDDYEDIEYDNVSDEIVLTGPFNNTYVTFVTDSFFLNFHLFKESKNLSALSNPLLCKKFPKHHP